MAKKLKDIVRVNAEPARGKVGLDPMDPWSAKANLGEASLEQYLMSKGINPKFVSKDTKISHAKSSSFIKWKQDHQFESVESLDEDALLDKFLMSRGINPRYATKDMKISHAKSGQFIKWKRDHMVEELTEAGTTKPSNKMTTLQKFRADAAAREKKHDDIEKEMKSRHAAGKEDMKGSIDRLEKQLNKEEIEHKVGDSVTVNSKFFGKQKGKVTKVDNQSVHVVRDGKSSAEKYPHDAVVKEAAGISKQKETSFHKKLDKLVHNTFGKRKDEMKMKEEVEQIDELNYDTVKSLYKKRRDDFHGDQVGKKKKGKEVSAKNVSRSISRLSGFKPTQNQPQKEDVYQDSQAATQTAFDMGTTPNQTEPTCSRKKEMSKSARIIKSIYKKKRMVKEDMYDHEKEDKSIQTYGKKPKVMEPDEKKNLGEKKPEARIVMSGGTTLTGEKRDTVEIDPAMKVRPGPDTFGATGKKASQQ